MTHTDTKENTATTDNRAARRPEAIEPGYHSPRLVRAIERHLDGETEPTTPDAVTIQAPQRRRTLLRAALAWARNHPGYSTTPREQALDRIRPAVRDPRP